MNKGLFITGTGTDVGKTHLTALLIKQLREAGLEAGYYKAALSGTERQNGQLLPPDAKRVVETCSLPGLPMDYISYALREAVSPHLAAPMENITIDPTKILADFREVSARFDYLTMEGSGGIICPLAWGDKPLMLTDIIAMLHLPVLIVAPAGLGTINATMLSVAYLQQLQLPIRAIVLNFYDDRLLMHRDNRQIISEMSGLPVYTCGTDAPQIAITTTELQALYLTY